MKTVTIAGAKFTLTGRPITNDWVLDGIVDNLPIRGEGPTFAEAVRDIQDQLMYPPWSDGSVHAVRVIAEINENPPEDTPFNRIRLNVAGSE